MLSVGMPTGHSSLACHNFHSPGWRSDMGWVMPRGPY